MAIVTGDRYLEKLVRFVEANVGPLIDGTLVLKLNPAGLRYVQSRLEALSELESLLSGAPVDYLRAYVSDLGDHRALEQLRRILRLLTSLKVVSVLAPPARDPTPLSFAPFGRLRVLELRGCDLSTSAAKGLLELRHTLERIVCHNSTDALRHVFASRIAEIKESPQWNRLSYVSCACNGLLLMDESLQLLPAVETLDLSRNKFTKVDNLRKCVRLKHLDLGFNQLRTVSSFSRVSSPIVKLVLRNNALTTLNGIENLKSLEDLDVSYNIISKFSELEFLTGLPSLGSLWLEGNPLCCARWHRPHAFSYISQLENFKLDDKEISTKEVWKRQLIIASRQKLPASFGFYSPAINDAQGEGSNNRRRKKITRLAPIEGEGESPYLCSDQDSVSVDNEVRSREEAGLSDDEAEIVDLMHKVELMKKERSVLWLREFKEWMDHASDDVVVHGKFGGTSLYSGQDNILQAKPNQRHIGESLGYESSKNTFDSDSPFMEISTDLHPNQNVDQNSLTGVSGVNQSGLAKTNLKDENFETSLQGKSSCGSTFMENSSVSPLTTIDSVSESHSSAQPGSSPPHYRKDILQRRQCLEEEILHLSEESFSVNSSDSNSSCSEDDAFAFGPMSDIGHLSNDFFSNTHKGFERDSFLDNLDGKNRDQRHQSSNIRENGQCSDMQSGSNDGLEGDNGNIPHFDEEDDYLNKRKGKRKTIRRNVSLLEGNDSVGKVVEPVQKSTRDSDFHVTEAENTQQFLLSDGNEEVNGNKQMLSSTSDEIIEDHFYSNLADSKNRETCWQYTRCYCVLESDPLCRERDVAVILSSENKLYVLLIGTVEDKSGTVLSLLACHRVEDVKEIVVGMGLQVVRVSFEKGLTYLFMTRSIEKSRQLLCTLELVDSSGKLDACSIKSLEQFQVDLFQKEIYDGSKVSIFQYTMILFWHGSREDKGELWVSRSLFIVGIHLLVCVEDLLKFGSLSAHPSSPQYFSLESYCSISDISLLVVEAKESQSVTLALARAKTGKNTKGTDEANKCGTWKLKWFSEDDVFKFVNLVKAIHAGLKSSPLPIRSVS